MAQPGLEEEIAEGFGWLRPETEAEIELLLARKSVRVPREWPPLEVPGRAPLEVPCRAPLDGLRQGCKTAWWETGSRGAMIQRDLIDW